MPSCSTTKPLLRWPLDIQHLQIEGQKAVLIRDPFGIANQPAVIPEVCLPIISRFDGQRSIADIAMEGKEVGLTEDIVQQVVKLLFELELLDNEHTRDKLNHIKKSYRQIQCRELSHSGLVYATEQGKLALELESYLKQTAVGQETQVDPSSVVAIFSPHIDYRRGCRAYASFLRLLRRIEPPDVMFLLGTTHQQGESLFVMSDKIFKTPFADLLPASDIITCIANKYGANRAFVSELLHKNEHSIELLLPHIGYAFASRRMPQIVPILVGSFYQAVQTKLKPDSIAEINQFIAAFCESIKKLQHDGKSFLIVCGVDLAHVGLHFGDSCKMSKDGLANVESEDLDLISHILRGNSTAFFQHLAKDGDKRRVCGSSTIYTVLNILERLQIKIKGTSFGYHQAVDEKSDCIVTFFSGCLNRI